MRPEPRTRSLLWSLCIGLSSVVAFAQPQRPEVVTLRDGLVVHPTAAEAYVMTPEGGVAAIDLGSGDVLWTSEAAAKPLAVAGDRLVAQVEPTTAAAVHRLELAVLRLRDRGAPGPGGAVELPGSVRVSVGETLTGTFRVSAEPADGTVLLTWSFVPSPRRGMPPPEDERSEAESFEPQAPEASAGALRMDLGTGRLAPAAASFDGAYEAATTSRAWTIEASEIQADPGLPRYESADGRHVLVSEMVADDRDWEKYRWSLFERATGRKLGEVRSFVSFAPFVVRDSVLVFETTPYVRAGRDEEPAKLRGVDPQTGEELWSVPVRETVWRGPVPP
jgi:hypothetical protein